MMFGQQAVDHAAEHNRRITNEEEHHIEPEKHRPRRPLRCVASLLSVGAAQAAVDITYTGYAAKDWDPINPQEQIFSATTPDPAAYFALAGGNNAQSITGAANGGSVFAMTNSFVVPVRVVANGYINSTGAAYGLLSVVVNCDAGGSSNSQT